MVGKKDKYLAAAQKFIERGQLDKALAEFTKVVQEDPKDTRTWLRLAELHAKRGANAEATEIYLRTGDLYTEQGFAQKAVAVYKNVLKLSPGTVAAHLKLGGLFKQLGLMSDAVQQMELASGALQRADKAQDAVAALRQAIEIQPDNVVLRVKLAECASGAGLTEEAVREFGKAADQLKAQGRMDESLRVVERLLFHQPQNFGKARELAEAYIAKGSPRLALPKLQACLNGDPRDPRTLSLLAKALEQMGQLPKAVSVLKELARLCGDLGRTSERDAAILRGLTLDPNDAELRAAAARNQVRAAGNEIEATPPPVEARDAATGGGGSFDLSGVVRMAGGGASGRVVAAIGAADSAARFGAAEAAPGASPEVSRILAEADVFVKYGLLERAVDHLGRVFELDPEQREARERLIAVLQRLGRKEDAASHLEILARQLAPTSRHEAKKLAEKALLLNPRAAQARALFEGLSGPTTAPLPSRALDDGDDLDADLATPPIVRRAPGASGKNLSAKNPFDEDDAGNNQWGMGVQSAASDDTDEQDVDQPTPPPVVSARSVAPASSVALARPVATASTAASAPSVASFLSVASRKDTRSIAVVSDLDVGDDDEGIDQVTPPPSVPRVSSVSGKNVRPVAAADDLDEEIRSGDVIMASEIATGEDDGDSSDEFSDMAATVAGTGEFLHAAATVAAGDAYLKAATAAGDAELAVRASVFHDEEEVAEEMDQVAFFVEQSMFDDARGLLQDLEARFPGHPRVAAQARELRDRDARLGALFMEAAVVPAASPGVAFGSTMIRGPSAGATPAPRAVVEGGDVPDFSTHADLAVAYKGMGLFDAAIGELKLLCQDPTREVFALTTMGECYEAKGTFTEAVIRYKRALNCEGITREETLELYYLLGGAFDRLGDVSEALYFFEKVAKRDPNFRDVGDKIAQLKPRMVKRAR